MLMLKFKKYISRFTTSYQIVCVENREYTGGSISVSPVYQGIEAMQNTCFDKDNLKSLIESKTTTLSSIYMKDDAPYIMYPINCRFDSCNYHPSYTITIYPRDYLIWDEVIHRFVVMQESIFLMLDKESLW